MNLSPHTMISKVLKSITVLLFGMLCFLQTVPAQTVTVQLNGTELHCRKPPIIVNDRVLVPMRDILEPLGYDVLWKESDQSITATKGTTTIVVYIGETYGIANDTHVVLDAAPMIVDDVTMVPLRFFTHYSNTNIVWNPQTYTVLIQTNVTQNAQTADSCVYIQTNRLQGSGVILSEDGLIATNYHVIDKASTAQIIFNSGEIYTGNIQIVGLDPQGDIALLKIEKTGLHAAKIGSTPSIGTAIQTITSGGGVRNTKTVGTIRGYNDTMISMSAPIKQGSSGGGLFSMSGELIGICSAYNSEQYFAIPIQNVLSVPQTLSLPLSSMKTYVYQPESPQHITYTERDGYFYIAWEPALYVDYYHVYISKTIDGPYEKMKNTTLNNDQWYWNFPHSFGVSLPNTDTFYIKVESIYNGQSCGISEPIKISAQ